MAKKSLTRRGLKIIVVGCGKVGETLTDQLTREGHEVTLIDKDPTKVHDLTNMYDVTGHCWNRCKLQCTDGGRH